MRCLPRILIASLALLGGCSSLGEEHSSIFTQTQPGLSSLDSVTKQDLEEESWWSHYYGH